LSRRQRRLFFSGVSFRVIGGPDPAAHPPVGGARGAALAMGGTKALIRLAGLGARARR
jgi:hypothetical protein